MKESFKIAGAFIGLIIGAGFASGQEVLQFFTAFGVWGLAAGVVATVLFAFLGMQIAYLGSSMSVTSHKSIIMKICGRIIGPIVDLVTTFFLFGVASVMLAGSGAVFEQQFGVPAYIGGIIMLALTILTLLAKLDNIVVFMGAATPVLFAIITIIAVVSILSNGIDFGNLPPMSDTKAAPNWFMGGILYVSYNIAAGAAMLMTMSGAVKNQKDASRGGFLGGLGLGILILIFQFAMLSSYGDLGKTEMPILMIADSISPILSLLMSIILLVMIYNTSVGMLYAFTARLINTENKKAFKTGNIAFGVIAYIASFFGFSSLVGTVYPVMGYLGFILIGAIVIYWVRKVFFSTEKVKSDVIKTGTN